MSQATSTSSSFAAVSYEQEYRESIEQPEAFWRKKAELLHWFKAPQQILSTDDNGIQRWFADGQMNTAYMALDHHVAQGRGAQTALIYDSPVTNSKSTYSYQQLTDAVAAFAGALKNEGVSKGDRVVIYMPMVPEAAIAMLACARYHGHVKHPDRLTNSVPQGN